MKMIIWVLWPAFAAAGIAELVFFTLIDPQQLFLLGQPIEVSPMAAYSIGFLLFCDLIFATNPYSFLHT